jgi:hypothetical protein
MQELFKIIRVIIIALLLFFLGWCTHKAEAATFTHFDLSSGLYIKLDGCQKLANYKLISYGNVKSEGIGVWD